MSRTLTARIDDPALDVHADDVLVLRNAGPKGAPGMPEAGYLPIPRKLARDGVKDMVRISDARMSGTAFGTIVLAHHAGVRRRRAARVRAHRRSHSSGCRGAPHRPADQRRRAGGAHARYRITPPRPPPARGYAALFHREVLQADEGCDFDFCARTLSANDDGPATHARCAMPCFFYGLTKRNTNLSVGIFESPDDTSSVSAGIAQEIAFGFEHEAGLRHLRDDDGLVDAMQRLAR